MLTFAVFNESGPATEWRPRNAHLLGADSAPLRGAVTFENGLLRTEPQTAGSTALAVQWDAGDLGLLTLPTCLLPARETPYLLSLELARHRLMLFLVKLEEWARFDTPADDPIMTTFEKARGAFTDALCQPRGDGDSWTPEHDRLAREALRLALEASELLTQRQADDEMRRRLNSTPPAGDAPAAPSMIGCAIDAERFVDPLKKVVADSFDFIVMPMRWVELEPEEGSYAFAKTDRWIEWAVRTAKLPVTGGPVVDFGAGSSAPDWLYIWEHDYETLRELVYEHVKQVVVRYRRAVSRWIIASGVHVNSHFTLSPEQMIDLTRLCALLVRKLHPQARIEVEIDQPFGECAAQPRQGIPSQLYAELVCQAGVAADSLGVRLQVGDVAPGRSTRDMMQLSDLLDRFSAFERPLTVSALGAPSAPPPAQKTSPAEEPPEMACDAGRWRGAWSEAMQSDWMTRALTVALSKPFVTSVCWQTLYDSGRDDAMPNGGLISAAGQPKQALRRIMQIRRGIRERRAPADLPPVEQKPANATE